MTIYVIGKRKLEDRYRGYSSDVYVYSESIDTLKENWRALFDGDVIVESGEWEMQINDPETWFNNGVVSRDSFGNLYHWSLVIYPLIDIVALKEGQK